jgi:hypothetical protein
VDAIARFFTTIANSTTGMSCSATTLIAEDVATLIMQKNKARSLDFFIYSNNFDLFYNQLTLQPIHGIVGIYVFCPALIPGNKYEETLCEYYNKEGEV